MTATTTTNRLILAGNDPPRVAWVADRLQPDDALERGVGFIYADVEEERAHTAMLPAQAALVIIVASADALDLLAYVLRWPGPARDGAE